MGWVPPSLPNSIVLLGGEDDAAKLTAEIVPGFEKWSSFHLFIIAGGRTFELRHNGQYACGIPDEDTIVMTGGWNHNYVTRWPPPHHHHHRAEILASKPSPVQTDWIVKN